MTTLNLAAPLADRKAEAIARVDTEAEAARMLFITGGAGQSQEYRLTEEQALAYVAASYPTPFGTTFQTTTYAFVYAEMQALNDADPTTYPMTTQGEIDALAETVADAIVAESAAWRTAAASIKRLRRAAKLVIDAATTHAEVYDAMQITWPTP